jgi:hypothetical protein
VIGSRGIADCMKIISQIILRMDRAISGVG